MKITKTMIGAFVLGTAAAAWWARRSNSKRTIGKMNEKEDVDAYNGDDKQAPFEEKAPRQRSL